MLSVRPFDIGDIIHLGKPYIHVTNKERRGLICDECLAELVFVKNNYIIFVI